MVLKPTFSPFSFCLKPCRQHGCHGWQACVLGQAKSSLHRWLGGAHPGLAKVDTSHQLPHNHDVCAFHNLPCSQQQIQSTPCRPCPDE